MSMISKVAAVVLGIALFAAGPAVAGEGKSECASCEAQGKDGGASCCAQSGKDGGAHGDCACCHMSYVHGQAPVCEDRTCFSDLALKEGRQPARWSKGNTDYGITVRNDGVRPDHTSNYRNACRNCWEGP